MTDKQFIETLRNIQKYCRSITCDCCKLSVKFNPNYDNNFKLVNGSFSNVCGIERIINNLNYGPDWWDINKIERLLKEYD